MDSAPDKSLVWHSYDDASIMPWYHLALQSTFSGTSLNLVKLFPFKLGQRVLLTNSEHHNQSHLLTILVLFKLCFKCSTVVLYFYCNAITVPATIYRFHRGVKQPQKIATKKCHLCLHLHLGYSGAAAEEGIRMEARTATAGQGLHVRFGGHCLPQFFHLQQQQEEVVFRVFIQPSF